METASHLIVTFLLNAAWQVTAILAIAFLCSLALRRAAARYQHPLWIAALVASLLLPAWSLRNIPRAAPTGGDRAEDSSPAFRVTVSGGMLQQAPQPARKSFSLPHLAPVPVRPWVGWTIMACYGAVVLYGMGRIAVAWQHTRKLRATPSRLDHGGRLSGVIDRYHSAFGLKRTPPAFITESAGPVTLGAFNPALFVPSALAEEASEDELMSAIGHELAHIRRRDYALNLACELISLPISFHPALLLIKSRIEQTRELACDEMAAEKTTGHTLYARSLLSIATSLGAAAPAANYGLGLFDTRKLEERIMHLVSRNTAMGSHWGRVLALVSLAVVTAVSIGASAFSLRVAQPAVSAPITAAMRNAMPESRLLALPAAAAPPAQSAPEPAGDAPEATQISIGNVTLVGGTELPGAQELVANELKAHTYNPARTTEIGERVRVLYQDYGFFQVMVRDPDMVPAGPNLMDVTIQVTAGKQYRLSQIEFQGAQLFTPEQLQLQFPIQAGQVFRTNAIRAGLEGIRRLYGSKGYRMIIAVPNTMINEEEKTVQLYIDVAEGPGPDASGPAALLPDPVDDFPGYFKVGAGVKPPHAIYDPEPEYDPASRAARVQGTAVFLVGIGTEGDVQKVRLRNGGSVTPGLIQNAKRAMAQWKFEPALRDGQPVPVQVSVEITFRFY